MKSKTVLITTLLLEWGLGRYDKRIITRRAPNPVPNFGKGLLGYDSSARMIVLRK